MSILSSLAKKAAGAVKSAASSAVKFVGNAPGKVLAGAKQLVTSPTAWVKNASKSVVQALPVAAVATGVGGIAGLAGRAVAPLAGSLLSKGASALGKGWDIAKKIGGSMLGGTGNLQTPASGSIPSIGGLNEVAGAANSPPRELGRLGAGTPFKRTALPWEKDDAPAAKADAAKKRKPLGERIAREAGRIGAQLGEYAEYVPGGQTVIAAGVGGLIDGARTGGENRSEFISRTIYQGAELAAPGLMQGDPLEQLLRSKQSDTQKLLMYGGAAALAVLLVSQLNSRGRR